jgi:hypothetical protein
MGLETAAAAGAVSAGTAAASTAAAAGAGAAATGLTLGSLMSYAGIASSLVSAGLAVLGSQSSAAAQRANAAVQRGQAAQAQFAAEQELLRGRSAALQIRQDAARTLAAQRTRYAAAGLTLDGTPETVADETRAMAERELGFADTNATIRAEQIRTQGNLLLSQAGFTDSGAGATGTLGTIGAGVNLFDSMERRYNRSAGTTINIIQRRE